MPSTKRLILAALIVATVALTSATPSIGASGGFGGGGDGGTAGGGEIGVWVVGSGTGSHGGGGGSGRTCWWTQVTTAIVPSNSPPIDVTRTIDGVLYNLYLRQCSDRTLTMFWIPDLSPAQLADAGRDLVIRKLPALSPRLSPPINTGGFVNFPTWFAAVDPGAISADATIPGLRATVTARVKSSAWSSSDGTTTHCTGLGVVRSVGSSTDSACSHTFTTSSAHQNGAAYAITVSVTWSLSWRSSTGQAGTLPDITTTSSFSYRVREIQTIGEVG